MGPIERVMLESCTGDQIKRNSLSARPVALTLAVVALFTGMVPRAVSAAFVLTTLVSFDGTNGQSPTDGLLMGSDGKIYGTTVGGGTNGGVGTVFVVSTNGVLDSLTSFN